MAIAEVGGGSQRGSNRNGGADSMNIAFPGSVISGNTLVVGGTAWSSGGTTGITVTDSLGTTYTIQYSIDDPGPPNMQYLHYIAHGVAGSSGANTVTVNPSGGSSHAMFAAIDEFSGVDTITPLDVDGGVSTGASTSPSDSLTTTTDNALILGVTHWKLASGTTTFTPSGSYTQIGEEEDNDTYEAGNFVFRIATSATSYTVDGTLGGSRTWYVLTRALRASSGGGAKKRMLAGLLSQRALRV